MRPEQARFLFLSLLSWRTSRAVSAVSKAYKTVEIIVSRARLFLTITKSNGYSLEQMRGIIRQHTVRRRAPAQSDLFLVLAGAFHAVAVHYMRTHLRTHAEMIFVDRGPKLFRVLRHEGPRIFGASIAWKVKTHTFLCSILHICVFDEVRSHL